MKGKTNVSFQAYAYHVYKIPSIVCLAHVEYLINGS